MSKTRWTAALAVGQLLLAGTLAGCSSSDSNGSPAETITPQQVDDAAQLAMIRAHQLAALTLFERGETGKAAKHAGHPAEEIFFSLSRSMQSRDAALTAELRESLRNSSDLLTGNAPVADVRASFEQGWEILDRAQTVLVPENVRLSADFRGAVVDSLLGTVADEYSEAVMDGQLQMEIEYQDAWGALQVAKLRFTAVQEDFGHDAAPITGHLATLSGYLPAVIPPKAVVPADVLDREVADTQAVIEHASEHS